ncbi:MAG TPA: FtsQ-type POTRA domain-containing protein [Longimicrobiaceae bacterium]|nr:FtsQ-type POTRA domain-containing protein [Longimicrobiaceae bacterium]
MRARGLLLAAAAAGALAAPFWAPPLLREVDWFAARRVEVTGARLVAPHEVLEASGVRIGDNVWSDASGWEAALLRHPVIAEARVTRRLPATLRIRVVEETPVALVQAGTLRPANGRGQVLPVDPARAQVDLPLLRAPAALDARGRLAAAPARAALAEGARLAALDPALMARVSELRPAAGGVELALAGADVLLRAGAGEPALARLRLALDDVERRAAADTTFRGRPVLDARFDDQVVVRRRGAPRTDALTHSRTAVPTH